MYVSEIQYGGCMHMEEALAVENWVKSVKFCLYSTKTRCYGGVQQAHLMKSTENFDLWFKNFDWFRYWTFSKTVCKRLESFSFGSKECGNTFIYIN